MIELKFTDQNVVVTGAASGLAYEVAKQFAEAGANVVVADFDMEGAEKAAEQFREKGVKSFAWKTDISKYEDFESLFKETAKQFGSIDILVNGAGIGGIGPITEQSPEFVSKLIDIDLKGPIWGCKAVAPYMMEQKHGKVVNFSSQAYRMMKEGSIAYGVSKVGVVALTACFAREMAPFDVNVNAIAPGSIRTPMWDATLEEWAPGDKIKQDELFKELIISAIPMGRTQDTKDIAHATLFLCSEYARNISGQCLSVDGAQTFSY